MNRHDRSCVKSSDHIRLAVVIVITNIPVLVVQLWLGNQTIIILPVQQIGGVAQC